MGFRSFSVFRTLFSPASGAKRGLSASVQSNEEQQSRGIEKQGVEEQGSAAQNDGLAAKYKGPGTNPLVPSPVWYL